VKLSNTESCTTLTTPHAVQQADQAYDTAAAAATKMLIKTLAKQTTHQKMSAPRLVNMQDQA